MWNLFNCYISGRHDYGVWCEPGEIYLRCLHCGRRSSGWSITRKIGQQPEPAAPVRPAQTASVVPFQRIVAN